MLTATYTLVALSVEQASVRISLLSFQHYVQANLAKQCVMTAGQLQYAADTLARLYQTCHWRKIERYLIPAVRLATPGADTPRANLVLDQIDDLNTRAAELMDVIADFVATPVIWSAELVAQFCTVVEAYCGVLLQRLELEERELYALARSVISGEAWFSIANQFLLHDARLAENRRVKAAPARPALTLAPGVGTAPAAIWPRPDRPQAASAG